MKSAWLLVWLCPYILLALIGGGLHNHSLAADMAGLGGACDPAALANERQATADCRACHWLLHSHAHAPAALGTADSAPPETVPGCSPLHPLAGHSLGRHIRAPPSL